MTTFLLTNAGHAELLQGVGAGDTTFLVEATLAARFPVPVGDQAFALILWDGTNPQEIVYCTNNPLTGTLTVQRNREDTTPRAWLAGTQLRHFLTAGTISNLLQEGFLEGNKASEAEAQAGIVDNKIMTPLGTTRHFTARTTAFSRDFLQSEDDVEARRALGWASAVFSGTGLETTFILPDDGYDTPYTRVYVDEAYQTGGYDIVGDQLIFDVPPASGTENIVVVLGENFAFSVSFPGDNTVTEDALVAGAVTTSKVANLAITTGKVANNAITYAKLQQASQGNIIIGRGDSGAGALGEIPFSVQTQALAALTTLQQLQTAITGNDWPVPPGTIISGLWASAPQGWVKANGTTIGSASSGGTGRANADTANLYALIWNNTSNTNYPIQNSSGVATTRGANAAADFAANKRLPLPDLRGEFLRGLDDSRGIDAARALGSSQTDLVKAHTHTFTTDSDGEHGHAYRVNRSDGNTTTTDGQFALRNSNSTLVNANSGAPSGGYQSLIGGTGSAHAHSGTTNANVGTENRPRNLAFLYCIKL